MSDTRTGWEAALMGPSIHPLERQYGLLDAALIGAGHTTNNMLSQLQRGYYTARRNLGDAFRSPETVREYQAELERLRREQQENARLYRPLTEAYPTTTAIGETLPSFLYGWRNGLTFLNANLDDRWTGGAIRGLLAP